VPNNCIPKGIQGKRNETAVACFLDRRPPVYKHRNITVPFTTPFDLSELPPKDSVIDKAERWLRADDQKKKITVLLSNNQQIR
jgi:hypothetical protein